MQAVKIFLNTNAEGEDFAFVRNWTGVRYYQDWHVFSFLDNETGGLELVHVSSIRCISGWITGKVPASIRVRAKEANCRQS